MDLTGIFNTELVDIGSQWVCIGALMVLGALLSLLWFSLQQAVIRVQPT